LTAEDLARLSQGDHADVAAVAGDCRDLDAAQLKPRIAATFGKLPKATTRRRLYRNSPSIHLLLMSRAANCPTNYIQGLFTAPPITSPDIYPMYVASSLLRDRVFEEVRVKTQFVLRARRVFENSGGEHRRNLRDRGRRQPVSASDAEKRLLACNASPSAETISLR